MNWTASNRLLRLEQGPQRLLRDWNICHRRGCRSWHWSREGSWGLIDVYKIPGGREWRRNSQALLSGAGWLDKRQWHEVKQVKLHLNAIKHSFSCEGGQSTLWSLVARRGCEVSFCGDAKNLMGHGLGPPAPADPAWAGGLDQKLPGEGGSFQFHQFCKSFVVLF